MWSTSINSSNKTYSNGFDQNEAERLFQNLPVTLRITIQDPPVTSDRSKDCNSVYWQLFHKGLLPNQVCAVVRLYPNGIAFKYIAQQGGDALEKDVHRAYEKFQAKNNAGGTSNLPKGYVHNSNSSVLIRKRRGNEEVVEPLCSPINFSAKASDDKGERWSTICEVQDPNGKWHKVIIERALSATAPNEAVRSLADVGLRIYGRNTDLARLVTNVEINNHVTTVRQPGWQEDRSFVFPDGTVIGNGFDSSVIYQPDHQMKHSFAISGSLAEWNAGVAGYANGNPTLILPLSVGFAGPLLRPLGKRGVILHFRGPSSLGKTTILNAAGSIYGGGGSNGFLQSWRTTDNAAEGMCALHNDCILILDEINEAVAQQIDKIAYMVTNGQGKGRANTNAMGRPRLEWREMGLSSGEISLQQHLNKVGLKETAGQAVRFLDIPADEGQGLGAFRDIHGCNCAKDFADLVSRNSDLHFGTAGIEFVARVQEDYEKIRSEGGTYISQFANKVCTPEASSQVKRIAEIFGLIAFAGELAITKHVVDWEKGSAEWAAKECFKRWLDNRGSETEDKEILDGIEHIRAFLQENPSRFPSRDNSAEYDRTVKRAEFYDKDGNRYLIFPKVFEREICRDIDHSSVAKALLSKGILVADKDNRLMKKVRRKDTGKAERFYAVNAAILEGDNFQ